MQNKEPAIDQSKCRICDSYELNNCKINELESLHVEMYQYVLYFMYY